MDFSLNPLLEDSPDAALGQRRASFDLHDVQDGIVMRLEQKSNVRPAAICSKEFYLPKSAYNCASTVENALYWVACLKTHFSYIEAALKPVVLVRILYIIQPMLDLATSHTQDEARQLVQGQLSDPDMSHDGWQEACRAVSMPMYIVLYYIFVPVLRSY